MDINQLEDDLGYPVDWSVLVDSGFLLIKDGVEVEFVEDTTRQYFGGKQMSKMLFMGGTEEEKAKEYIQFAKYTADHTSMLFIIAGEVSKDRGMSGIRQLLRIINARDVEPLGLQHLRIKMGCLQQWCLESNAQTDYHKLDREFKISKSFMHWLRRGVTEVRQKSISVDDTILKEVVAMMGDCLSVVALMRNITLQMLLSEVTKEGWNVHDLVIEALGWAINADVDEESWVEDLLNGLHHRLKTVRQATTESIPKLAQISKESVPRLLDVLRNTDPNFRTSAYDQAVVHLLRHVPEDVNDNIEMLIAVCRNPDYWTRQEIMKVIPSILADAPERVHCLTSSLLKDCTEIVVPLSPGIIEALAVCLVACPPTVPDIVDVLLKTWRQMGEDQRRATATTLVKSIQISPDKATEIFERLLEDDSLTPWPMAYPLVKIILSVLSEIPNHVETVVNIIKQHHAERRENIHDVAMVLETIKHAIKASTDFLPLFIPELQKSFNHNEWSIRSMAFQATGSIAKHQPMKLTDDLIEAVMNGCKGESPWKSKCAAFEAAAEILISHVQCPGLLTVCQEALGDADDVIRSLAAKAVKTALVSDSQERDHVVDALLRAYEDADDHLKHGIIQFLYELSLQFPEVGHHVINILIQAVSSLQSMISSVAVKALSYFIPSGIDIGGCIEPLSKACDRRERDIQFNALEALKRCVQNQKKYNDALIRVLKNPMNPLNEKEWMIYLSALETGLKNPREDIRDLVDALLMRPGKDLPNVHKTRREIVDRMTMTQLLLLYEKTKAKSLIDQMVRLSCNSPIILSKSRGHSSGYRMIVYQHNSEVMQCSISHQLYSILYRTLRRVRSSFPIMSQLFPHVAQCFGSVGGG